MQEKAEEEETLIALPGTIGMYGKTVMCPYLRNGERYEVLLLRTRMGTKTKGKSSDRSHIRNMQMSSMRKRLIALESCISKG